jgi:hypothetical protein
MADYRRVLALSACGAVALAAATIALTVLRRQHRTTMGHVTGVVVQEAGGGLGDPQGAEGKGAPGHVTGGDCPATCGYPAAGSAPNPATTHRSNWRLRR